MELIKKLKEMHKGFFYHKKRGFLLGTVTPTMVSCHLLEEAVELQAEIISDNHEGIVEEAADVYLLLMHLFVTLNLDIKKVETEALQKLEVAFTTKRTKLNPGFTRRNRDGNN